jgi:hypothetical protein
MVVHCYRFSYLSVSTFQTVNSFHSNIFSKRFKLESNDHRLTSLFQVDGAHLAGGGRFIKLHMYRPQMKLCVPGLTLVQPEKPQMSAMTGTPRQSRKREVRGPTGHSNQAFPSVGRHLNCLSCLRNSFLKITF